MDIADFIAARLDEDEQAAREACAIAEAEWRIDDHTGETVLWWPPEPDVAAKLRSKGMWREASGADEWRGQTIESGGERIAPHIARHDPARVLAEVEAKRRILARHHPAKMTSWAPAGCEGCGVEGDCDDPITEHIDQCPELRDLAAVYGDHPDYDPAWAPV